MASQPPSAETLATELTQAQDAIRRLQRRLERSNTKTTELESLLLTTERESAALRSEKATIITNRNALETNLSAARAEKAEIENRLSKSEAISTSLRTEVDSSTSACEKLRNQISALRKALPDVVTAQEAPNDMSLLPIVNHSCAVFDALTRAVDQSRANQRAVDNRLTQVQSAEAASRAKLADREAECKRLLSERDAVKADHEKLVAEHVAASAVQEVLIVERDSLIAEKDTAISNCTIAMAEHENLLAKLEAASATQEKLIVELDTVKAEMLVVVTERDSVMAELASIVTERDAILAEKISAVTERDSIKAAHEMTLAERDELMEQKEAVVSELNAAKVTNSNISAEREAAHAALEKLNGERDAIMAERETLVVEHDSLKAAHEYLVKEHSALNATHLNLIVERDGISAEKETVSVERDSIKSAHDALVADHEVIIASVEKITMDRNAVMDENRAVVAERDERKAASEKLTVERDAMLAAQKDLAKELDAIRSELESITAERETLKSELLEKSTELEWLTSHSSKTDSELKDLRSTISDLNEKLESTSQSASTQADAARAFQQQLLQARTVTQDKQSTVDSLQARVEKLNQSLSDKAEAIDRLKGELKTESARREAEVRKLQADLTLEIENQRSAVTRAQEDRANLEGTVSDKDSQLDALLKNLEDSKVILAEQVKKQEELEAKSNSEHREQQCILSQTEEKLAETLSSLQKVQGQLDEHLRFADTSSTEKDSALNALRDEIDRIRHENDQQMASISVEKDNALAAKDTELADMALKLQFTEAAIQRLQGDMTAVQLAAKDSIISLEQKCLSKHEDLESMTKELENTRCQLESHVASAKVQYEKFASEISNRNKTISDLEVAVCNLQKDLASKNDELLIGSKRHESRESEIREENAALQRKLTSCESKLRQIEDDLKVKDQDFDDEIKRLMKEASKHRDEMQRKINTAEQSLNQTALQFQQTIRAKEDTVLSLQENLALKESDCSSLTVELCALKEERNALSVAKHNLSREVSEKISAIRKLREDLGASQSVSKIATIDAMELDERLVRLEDYVQELEGVNNVLLGHVDEFKSVRATLEEKQVFMNEEKLAIIKSLEEVERERDALDKELVDLREYARSCVKETEAAAANDIAELQTKNEALSAEVVEVNTKVDEETKIQDVLRRQISALEESIKTCNEDARMTKQQNNDLTTKVEKLTEKSAGLSDALRECNSMLSDAREVGKKTCGDLLSVTGKLKNTEAQIKQLKSNVEQARKSMDALADKVASTFNASEVLVSSLREKDNTVHNSTFYLAAIRERLIHCEQVEEDNEDLREHIAQVDEDMAALQESKGDEILSLKNEAEDLACKLMESDLTHQKQIDDFNVKLGISEQSAKDFSTQLEELRSAHSQLQKNRDTFLQQTTSEKQDLSDQLNVARLALTDITNLVGEMRGESSRIAKRCTNAENDMSVATSRLAVLTERVESLQKSEDCKSVALEQTQTSIAELGTNQDTLLREKEIVSSELSSKVKQLQDAEDEVTRLTSLISELRSTSESVRLQKDSELESVASSLKEKHLNSVASIEESFEVRMREARETSERVTEELKAELACEREKLNSTEKKLMFSLEKAAISSNLSRDEMDKLSKKLESAQEACDSLNLAKKNLEASLTEKEEQMTNLEKQCESLSDEVWSLKRGDDHSAERLSRASEAIRALESKNESLQKDLNDKIQENEEAVSSLSQKLEETKANMQNINNDRETLRRSVERHEGEIQRLEEKVVQPLRKELCESKISLEKAVCDLDSKANELSALSSERQLFIQKMTTEMDNLRDRLHASQRQIEEEKDKSSDTMEQLTQEKNGAVAEVQTLESQLADLHSEMSAIKEEVLKLEDAKTSIKAELKAMTIANTAAEDRIRSLTDSMEKVRASSADEIARVMREADSRLAEVKDVMGRKVEDAVNAKQLAEQKTVEVSSLVSELRMEKVEEVERVRRDIESDNENLRKQLSEAAEVANKKDGGVEDLEAKLSEVSRQAAEVDGVAMELETRMKASRKMSKKYKASVRSLRTYKSATERSKGGEGNVSKTPSAVNPKLAGLKRGGEGKSPAMGGRRVRRTPMVQLSENDVAR